MDFGTNKVPYEQHLRSDSTKYYKLDIKNRYIILTQKLLIKKKNIFLGQNIYSSLHP